MSAEIRASFRRRRSLRWRAKKALSDAKTEDNTTWPQTVSRATWFALGRPWIPLILAGGVAALQVYGPDRTPLAVFQDEDRSRELLGLLWQVEAAAIALVLAASLFVFESLTRRRASLPLVEYANRSRLAQFLMLAAAGLLAIPMVLFLTPGLPTPSAAFTAALIGLFGLGALPFFLIRAMKVVSPSWLREERLADIHRASVRQVAMDAFERVAMAELRAWATGHKIEVLHRMILDDQRVTEVSSSVGTVLDLDLDKLEEPGMSQPNQLAVVTRLSENVWDGAALIGRLQTAGPFPPRAAVTVSRSTAGNDMDQVVSDLHEEANEAVRQGSPLAAEQVAAMYSEVWLGWPREWATYGQRLQGLLKGLEEFQIRPTDELKRNIATTVQLAVNEGLQDHVQAFQGILWRVGLESLRLDALDLIREMNTLARWLLTTESRAYPELADRVVENAWRYQIDVCERAAWPLESGDEMEVERAQALANQVREFYRSLTESLRVLSDSQRFEAFRTLDGRFVKILQYWDPMQHEILARRIVESPERYSADDETVARAKKVLELDKLSQDLRNLRRAGRLTVLGWILRRGPQELGDDAINLARSVAGTLGDVDELVTGVGSALDESHDLLGRWIMFDHPERETVSLDSEGPILRAFALSLLSRPSVDRIPPATWINEHLAQRFDQILTEVAEWQDFWGRLGEDINDVTNRAAKIRSLFETAKGEQEGRERAELAERPLDMGRVHIFRSAAVEGWREGRVLPDLASLTDLEVRRIPLADWTGNRFGYGPRLDPKGLFVTPTNWVGLEDNARERGRLLAQGEVTDIIRLLVEHAPEVDVEGDPMQRLLALLAQLRADRYEPSLIVLPIEWRLSSALGLEVWREDQTRTGLGRNFKGVLHGVPVIDWWEVPKDRMYAIDVARFCEAEEGVEDDGTASPPEVSVERIDAAIANEITAHWDPLEGEEEQQRRMRVLTSVRTSILRPYGVRLGDPAAARSVLVPPQEEE